METQGWAALGFALGAAIVIIIALVLRFRANRRWRSELQERDNAAEAERKALRAEAESAHVELRRQKTQLQEEADARLDALAAEHAIAFQDRRMLVDFLKERARRSIEAELVSREAILQASATLGLNGVLATRTLILVQQGMSTNRHVVQLDHVLLTEAGALLVDNRSWGGVIFDGLTPSDAQPAFAHLIDDAALRPPFAVQIASSGAAGSDDASVSSDATPDGALRVITRAGDNSPRRQALARATHLEQFVEETLGDSITVDTCVFYSNAAATVFTDAATLTPSADRTAVVSNEAQFLDLLVRRERARRRPLTAAQLEELTTALHEQGAKIDALGEYARLHPGAGSDDHEQDGRSHGETGASSDESPVFQPASLL